MQFRSPERVYGWCTAAPVKARRTTAGKGLPDNEGSLPAVPGSARCRFGMRITDPVTAGEAGENPKHRSQTGGQEWLRPAKTSGS